MNIKIDSILVSYPGHIPKGNTVSEQVKASFYTAMVNIWRV